MIEIFSELYKKVLGFFQTQEKEQDASKNVAVNRMKLVLMQDRTNLTPYLLERMRGEMIEVLAKYVEMDKEALELNFEQEGEQMALMLSIPVLRAKDEEEIQAMIEEEEKSKQQITNSESEEESESVEEIENTEEAEEFEEEDDSEEIDDAEEFEEKEESTEEILPKKSKNRT